MEVFIVNLLRWGQDGFQRYVLRPGLVGCFRERLVAFLIVFIELILGQLQSLTELDSYLLLFQEYEFVILHVFFRIGLQISSKLMQVEAVLVAAPLSIQEELAELWGAEGSSDHSIVQYELIDW